MSKARKTTLAVIAAILGVIVLAVVIFLCAYATRLKTVSSIEKLSAYEDGWDLYTMDIQYEYDLQDLIDREVTTDAEMFGAIFDVAMPLLTITPETPDFGCTAFQLTTTDGTQLMGRNYDFSHNTSAMLVKCSPKDGYKSIAFAALDNVSANQPFVSATKKLTTLTTPFLCLDGLNEKGVSIAVLVVDSEPMLQDTGRGNLFTTLVIRLVLDKAATTQEAVELISQYDIVASAGRDYHFYINDASGDGRVVEWDCDSPTRELVATPVDTVTNFYTIYADRVEPYQYNGIYGHGKERYEFVKEVFAQQEGEYTVTTAWDALKAAAQTPKEGEITSNTQWSIVFDNTNLTAEVVIRRNWTDTFKFDINGDLL